jgi:putative salt-induced outer membrane protein YdiY
MKLCFLSMLIITLSATLAKPEVVYFKNGDRLTGKWLRIQGDKLTLKSDALGKVEIPLDKLQPFSISETAVLLLKQGELLEGTVTWKPSGDWQVETTAGKQAVSAQSVEIIYPAQILRQKGYSQKPRIWKAWTGKGALGYSLVRGDQNAKTLSVNINASRRVPVLPELKERARTNFSLDLIFANTQNTQGLIISANSFSTGIRQDFKFTNKNFWFLLAQADHSQAQSLNLRQTYGAGLGRDIFHRQRFDLQGVGGLTFVNEHFGGHVVRKSAEVLIGEKVHWNISRWLRFDHALSFFPTVTDEGGYRIDSTSGVSTLISKRFSFNTTYTDHYLSRPLPGHLNNELILTTGVGVVF